MIPKTHLSEFKRFEQLLRERKILIEAANAPFVASLHASFESDFHLNFLLEFYCGGELFFHLLNKKLTENEAKFYFVEIVICFQYLHQNKILYRDLKVINYVHSQFKTEPIINYQPENIVLDIDGHVRLTDFGLSKIGMHEQEMTDSFCGSPEYMAPEILLRQGYSYSVDFYTLGAFLFELVTGLPPFYANNTETILNNIINEQLEVPDYLDIHLKDLLFSLLDKRPPHRIKSFNQIKSSKWLSDVNWEDVQNLKIPPPISIDINSSYIHSEFRQTSVPHVQSCNKESLFKFFNYVNPSSEKLFTKNDSETLKVRELSSSASIKESNNTMNERDQKKRSQENKMHNSMKRISNYNWKSIDGNMNSNCLNKLSDYPLYSLNKVTSKQLKEIGSAQPDKNTVDLKTNINKSHKLINSITSIKLIKTQDNPTHILIDQKQDNFDKIILNQLCSLNSCVGNKKNSHPNNKTAIDLCIDKPIQTNNYFIEQTSTSASNLVNKNDKFDQNSQSKTTSKLQKNINNIHPIYAQNSTSYQIKRNSISSEFQSLTQLQPEKRLNSPCYTLKKQQIKDIQRPIAASKHNSKEKQTNKKQEDQPSTTGVSINLLVNKQFCRNSHRDNTINSTIINKENIIQTSKLVQNKKKKRGTQTSDSQINLVKAEQSSPKSPEHFNKYVNDRIFNCKKNGINSSNNTSTPTYSFSSTLSNFNSIINKSCTTHLQAIQSSFKHHQNPLKQKQQNLQHCLTPDFDLYETNQSKKLNSNTFRHIDAIEITSQSSQQLLESQQKKQQTNNNINCTNNNFIDSFENQAKSEFTKKSQQFKLLSKKNSFANFKVLDFQNGVTSQNTSMKRHILGGKI